MRIEKREDVTPRCPHCEEELARIFYRQLDAMLGKRYLYFCGDCRAVLGVSHRKGFWMG